MLVKAEGVFSRRSVTKIDHARYARLVFYGKSLFEIRSWLSKFGTEHIAYTGKVHVYEGYYHKSKKAKSEMYDSMSIRHAGWGKGTLGTPGLTGGIKVGMQIVGAVQTRHYIGVIHHQRVNGDPTACRPNFMHHQKRCHYLGEFSNGGDNDTGSFTLALLRSKRL